MPSLLSDTAVSKAPADTTPPAAINKKMRIVLCFCSQTINSRYRTHYIKDQRLTRFIERQRNQSTWQLLVASDISVRYIAMIKAIMDVDTGIDDAIALMMALQSPKIEIVGITTVSGNVSARIAGLNTLAILNITSKQLEIPVMQGATRPLSKKKIVHAEEVHGKKGLANINLEYNQALLRKGKISHFISTILANYRKKEVSLVATGPLTNIAKAIIEEPGIIDSLSRICIMGGAYGLASKVYGNITQYAEFNFYCDPKAAQIVLCSSQARLKVVGLDATDRYLIVDNKFIARLDQRKCKAAKIAKSLLQYPLARFGRFNLPDVFAVGMLERPSLFKFKRGQVVIMQDEELRGHSKFRGVKKNGNVFVVEKVDQNGFNDYVFSRL
jgi:inosine-uridine nucleoside N-ribohydrolase